MAYKTKPRKHLANMIYTNYMSGKKINEKEEFSILMDFVTF